MYIIHVSAVFINTVFKKVGLWGHRLPYNAPTFDVAMWGVARQCSL